MGNSKKTLACIFLGLGIIFHSVYVFSVITIYFQSPLVFGLAPQRGLSHEAPAKRLVLLVGDGLRADKFFERNMEAPFLRSKIEMDGLWGVSHTRVPTESRPGHVAMISGFYEDVSAVTKGWKDNPVEFDSIFNRSKETWAWGSPDILPMFSSRTDHMNSDMYAAEYEDFGMGSAVHLDNWVFDRFEQFFKVEVPNSPPLQSRVNQDQIIFFLHLLGIDTIGHAKRPTSQDYINNIIAVDQGIQKVVETIENYYKDGKTAYIFTSDHGMADRGIHGDGDPDNTETPFLAWGSGVSKPKYSSQHPSILIENSRPTPSNWRLNHLARFDLTQADISPLMATLIGVPIPVNSVGVLPSIYLNASESFKTEALLDNANEILSQFVQKQKLKQSSTADILFSPFEPLSNYQDMINNVKSEISNNNFEKAQQMCLELIKLTLLGLRYYETYDKILLLSITISGYLGFIALSATLIVSNYATKITSNFVHPHHDKPFLLQPSTLTGILFSIGFFYFLHIQSSPWIYYVYSIFPLSFWTIVAGQLPLIKHALNQYFARNNHMDNNNGSSKVGEVVTIIISFALVQAVVIGFHFRQVFAPCFWALAFWGLFIERRLTSTLKLTWTVLCLICSIFPLIPVDIGDMTPLLIGSAIIVVVIGFILSIHLPTLFNYGLLESAKSNKFAMNLYSHQLNEAQTKKGNVISLTNALLVMTSFAATIIVYITESSLKSSNGLPLINQYLSWAIMLVCGILWVRSGATVSQILLTTFLSLVSPMILLSINFEVVFFTTFFLFCINWIIIERHLYLHSPEASEAEEDYNQMQSKPSRSSSSFVSLQSVRVASMYILCCFFAFFGIGNLAGFSGVELSSSFRFLTVFDPFTMAALLVLKILIPFMLLCAIFGVLNRQMNMTDQLPSFMIVSLLSDSMTLVFLCLVKDYGSWREIGLSISNFAMLNFFLAFQAVLSGLTQIMLWRLPSTPIKHDIQKIKD